MTSSVRFFYENTPSIDRTATIQRAIKTFPTIGEMCKLVNFEEKEFNFRSSIR